MAIFNSYVSLPEGTSMQPPDIIHQLMKQLESQFRPSLPTKRTGQAAGLARAPLAATTARCFLPCGTQFLWLIHVNMPSVSLEYVIYTIYTYTNVHTHIYIYIIVYIYMFVYTYLLCSVLYLFIGFYRDVP